MNIRPRRNRKLQAVRDMVQETWLTTKDLLYPLFLVEGKEQKIPVKSMPGIYRLSLDNILMEIEMSLKLGITAFAIFPALPEFKKDKYALESYREGNMYAEAIRTIKESFPEIVLMTDVAMDPYSSDGHDGLVENGQILNDETLPILAKMALVQAQAGADILGPSDMMDGRVGYIRNELDKEGYTQTSIMSYTAKYASSFYGPFREALDSAPKKGDKKTYQMNPANKREALIEVQLDMQEGADILMVKPALSYLDIIHVVRENTYLPVAAYNVSGEYAMIKFAAQAGCLNEESAVMELLLSIKRAGADIILTYFAKQAAVYLKAL
jgi:porphobilinogen synthase